MSKEQDLIEAAQEFIDRCDRGEIRSKYTYAKFKAILGGAADHHGIEQEDKIRRMQHDRDFPIENISSLLEERKKYALNLRYLSDFDPEQKDEINTAYSIIATINDKLKLLLAL
jgi:hypothetical protein